MAWKTYMPKASRSTIRGAADLRIGENLMGLRVVSRSTLPACITSGAYPGRPDYRSRPQKKPHPILHNHAFYTRMKENDGLFSRARVMDHALAAMEQMELYCQAHPGSPAAVRRPRLFVRGDLWVALLGPSVEEGIVGIGPSVTAALRAFDAQYLAGLRPPAKTIENYRSAGSASSAAV